MAPSVSVVVNDNVAVVGEEEAFLSDARNPAKDAERREAVVEDGRRRRGGVDSRDEGPGD